MASGWRFGAKDRGGAEAGPRASRADVLAILDAVDLIDGGILRSLNLKLSGAGHRRRPARRPLRGELRRGRFTGLRLLPGLTCFGGWGKALDSAGST